MNNLKVEVRTPTDQMTTMLISVSDIQEIIALVRASDHALYIRWSEGVEMELEDCWCSVDHSTGEVHEGLSCVRLLGSDAEVQEQICRYAGIREEHTKYGWIISGREIDEDSDKCPLVDYPIVVKKIERYQDERYL